MLRQRSSSLIAIDRCSYSDRNTLGSDKRWNRIIPEIDRDSCFDRNTFGLGSRPNRSNSVGNRRNTGRRIHSLVNRTRSNRLDNTSTATD